MKLLTENIWETITRSVKKRKPNYVAVAYFGADGANLLPLKKGDILVVDASEQTVLKGATDPKALHILLDKGVRVFSKERLHAKVFVLGDLLFLGSANVSTNSKFVLHEAVLQTDDPKLVEDARSYINDLPKKELTKGDLKFLTSIYSPPVNGKKKHRVANSQFRLYTLEIDRIRFSEGVESIIKIGKAKAREEMESDEGLEVVEVELDETIASLEFILQFELKEKGWYVYPPREVVHKERIMEKGIALLFIVKKKGLRGIYEDDLKRRISRRNIPRNQWLTQALTKRIMEYWEMTFN